jgi:hypothetical protein
MRRGTCGRGPEGSGYVKPRDPQKAAEVENAYAAILASRATLDSFWKVDDAIPVYQHVQYDPNGSNAQPGWPVNEPILLEEFTGIDDDIKYVEILDVSGADVSDFAVDVSDFAVEPVPLEFDEGEFDVITYAEDVPDTTKSIEAFGGSNCPSGQLALDGSNCPSGQLTQSPLLPSQSPPPAAHPPR